MRLTNRLLAHGLTLAAIAARPRLDELGERGDPALREQLDRIVDELRVREQRDGLEPGERSPAGAGNPEPGTEPSVRDC
jgi:hypothetical protein